jgi:hypothetical protein
MALIATMLIGVWSCTQWSNTSLYEGEYFPVGSDSFYHAARIIHKHITGELLQYDMSMHAPEGSLIVWPWLYDSALAYYVSAVVHVSNGKFKTDGILAYSTLGLFIISIFLVHSILSALKLSGVNHFIGLLLYSLSPLTQGLYGVGRIDHHGAEQIAFLLITLLGLYWTSYYANKKVTVALAVTLGLAPAIHTSLVILILPISSYLLFEWATKNKIHNLELLGLTTLLVTVLAASQSLSVQELRFEFYSYSWFHIYISSVFLFLCSYISRNKFNRRTLLVLMLMLIMFSIPALLQVNAFRYLSGDLYNFNTLIETRSPLMGAENLHIRSLASFYSGLIYFIPFVTVWCIWVVSGNNPAKIRYLALTALFGLALALIQFRFFVFGTVALIIVTTYLLDKYVSVPSKYTWLYVIFVFVSTQAWSFPTLVTTPPKANDPDFLIMLPGFKYLKDECAGSNSIILAESNDGHYIRYFSNCRVISNNFLLTRQHEQKSRLVNDMLNMSVEELIAQYPWVDYVFVRIYPHDLGSYPNLPKLKAGLLFEEGPYQILNDSNITINAGSSSFPAYRIVKLIH